MLNKHYFIFTFKIEGVYGMELSSVDGCGIKLDLNVYGSACGIGLIGLGRPEGDCVFSDLFNVSFSIFVIDFGHDLIGLIRLQVVISNRIY